MILRIYEYMRLRIYETLHIRIYESSHPPSWIHEPSYLLALFPSLDLWTDNHSSAELRSQPRGYLNAKRARRAISWLLALRDYDQGT